jgi:hypothetical protein
MPPTSTMRSAMTTRFSSVQLAGDRTVCRNLRARYGTEIWRMTCGCGDERTRTADPLLAKQVLYQLSYVPCLPAETPNHDPVHGSDSGSLHST